MAVKGGAGKTKNEIHCQRCHGRTAFEKFYGQDSSFFGWHCVMCGDVLDPVILLHRLTQDANVSIPESEKELMWVIKKYMRSRPAKKYIDKNTVGKDSITL
jgi:late competence protein required for DNA uptake (superfamily II DNA/RNA helicase)